MKKVFISTFPFGDHNKLPLELLNSHHIEYKINPIGRRLNENEMMDIIGEYNILIAGTEPISQIVLSKAKNLELISRVGIGTDNINLEYAKSLGIHVTYTPDAPAPAVAELTVGLMFSLLRKIHLANDNMHRNEWIRYFGYRITEITVGIIGVGRIGSKVLSHLLAFKPKKIYINDIACEKRQYEGNDIIEFVDKDKIYKESDIISLHIPLTNLTRNLIANEQLALMKREAMIINTSRGGIINEGDLASALSSGIISSAAIDVYENEPYTGLLNNIRNCLLTSHMGSMSYDCRAQMEIEATQEVIRYLNGEKMLNPVPEEEYINQRERRFNG